MPHAYRMVLGAAANDRAIIAGDLIDEEATTLNRFLDQYEDLIESKPVRDGLPCELRIHVEAGKAAVAADLPSRDELDILFQRLRLFMLQKERTSFVNVCAILRRQFTDLRLRELINEQHAAFHNHPDHLSSALVINNVAINREEMLTDWVYGYQYHGDDERRDDLRRLGIDVRSPFIQHILVGLLLNKQTAITNIAALVAVLLDRSPSLDICGATLSKALLEVT